MRLNKYQKQAFVRAVMQDTPDPKDKEQIIKEVLEIISREWEKKVPQEAVKLMQKAPEMLRKVYWAVTPDIDPQQAKYSQRNSSVVCRWLSVQGCGDDIELSDLARTGKFSKTEYDKAKKIVTQWREGNLQRERLRQRLEGLVNGCSTLKQLKQALPEFEKYMPTEEQPSKNLPAVANLVTDFVKAGWPKDKQGKLEDKEGKVLK